MELKIQNYVRIIAGIFIIISVILGYLINKYWLLLTLFVGLNLFQSGFTNKCPLNIILKKIGIKE